LLESSFHSISYLKDSYDQVGNHLVERDRFAVARITIPKLVVELLEIEAGDVVQVTLYEAKPP